MVVLRLVYYHVGQLEIYLREQWIKVEVRLNEESLSIQAEEQVSYEVIQHLTSM